jgi:hypothetical protein
MGTKRWIGEGKKELISEVTRYRQIYFSKLSFSSATSVVEAQFSVQCMA